MIAGPWLQGSVNETGLIKLIREIQKRFWCIHFPHIAYWLLAPLFCLHCLCWSMNELEVSPNEVGVAPTGMIREQMEDDILGSNGASAWLSTKTSATGRVGQPSSSKRKGKGCWTRSWFEHGGPSLSPRRKASCLAFSHFEHRSSHKWSTHYLGPTSLALLQTGRFWGIQVPICEWSCSA